MVELKVNCHIIYRVVVIYFTCPLHDCKQLWVHIALLFPFVKLTWFTRRELRSLNTLLFKNLALVGANNQLGMDWNLSSAQLRNCFILG